MSYARTYEGGTIYRLAADEQDEFIVIPPEARKLVQVVKGAPPIRAKVEPVPAGLAF